MRLRAKILGLVPRGETLWLLRSGGGLGGMQMFNLSAGLATTVLLARLLGTEDYGLYAFALGWVFILGMPMHMGLPTLVMRQVAIYRVENAIARLKGILRWTFRLIGLSTLVIGSVCCVVALSIHFSGKWPERATPLLLGSAFVLLGMLGLISIYRSIACGFENVIAGNTPDTLVRPALLLLGIVALSPFLALDPGLVMVLHAVAALLAAGLAWAMSLRRVREITNKAPSQQVVIETRLWLSSLWPMTIISGAAMINSRVDIAMLGIFNGPSNVAIYDIGTKVGGLLMIAQALLNASIAPRIARLYASRDIAQVQSLMVQACRLSFFASAILLFILWFLGSYIVNFLFGSDFKEAALTATILGVGYVMNTSFGAVGTLLNMSGHERVTAFAICSAAAVNALLNLVLIPTYGAPGAAVSASISTVLMQSMLWWKVRSRVGIRTDVLAFKFGNKSKRP